MLQIPAHGIREDVQPGKGNMVCRQRQLAGGVLVSSGCIPGFEGGSRWLAACQVGAGKLMRSPQMFECMKLLKACVVEMTRLQAAVRCMR